jgi:hypothetical protein
MGGTVTRKRFLSAFVAVLAGLGVRIADASPPPASSLEQQAATEFAKTGFAVRERLDREGAGDPIGATIAAHEVEMHRFRYLDLKREIKRQHPQSRAFLSVAAPRDPFVPDGSFPADSSHSATRSVAETAGGRGEVIRTSYPSWDMYRPRLSKDGAGAGSSESSPAMRAAPVASAMAQAKDMYAPGRPKDAPPDERAPGTEALVPSADGPRQPFLVYREPSAGASTRE